jgi:predicted GNAT superfamily acetyltransferase
MMELHIRPVASFDDANQLEALQLLVWPGSELDVVPAHFLLTIARNGGLVLGAFDRDHLVGFVVGFLGTDRESPNRPAMAQLKHHSHMLGVHPDYRDKGIGFRLKVAQREFVHGQGIRLITWTYDPLQSRNAYLNIHRLGTICRKYHRETYGEMRDQLNVGYPSDRFEVEWWITTSRVKSRINEARQPLDLANFLGAGATKINPAELGDANILQPAEFTYPIENSIILVEIPSDIGRIKEYNMELANAWRLQTRDIFEEAFSRGYLVTDFVHLKEERFPRSYYVLSHGERTLG